MSQTDRSPRPPLRERKRNNTRRALQRAAVDLVERNGYQATSVEDICDAADVSRSTFFRYFGSKDAVFGSNIVQEEFITLLEQDPPASLRELENRVVTFLETLDPQEWETQRRCTYLLQNVPELHAKLLTAVFRPFALAVRVVARIGDLPEDSTLVRTVAGALIGALAAHHLPRPDEDYDLPATVPQAVAMYRGIFAELDMVLNLDVLPGPGEAATSA